MTAGNDGASPAEAVPEDGVKKIKVDLIDDGILWLINRTVFHPRGFALAYDRASSEFILWGNGDEPWEFSGETENGKFNAVEAKLREATVTPPAGVDS
ncbi:MAG TPA: hypothetical protein VGH54_21430 [Mycobacterium sp.]|jgi:hypothetical protein|uniref:hypothetical protein n=1 Tax=Mycobacterium sp. TaxID=1785 RepID=UPI002F415EAA